MAIINGNPAVNGASGTVGKLVYKRWRGKIVLANKPGRRKKTTEKQRDNQEDFRSAVRWAKSVCKIPETKAMYAKGINDKKHSANAVALSDALNPPEIGEIDILAYTGAPGELIRVRAFDDFKVKSVSITITSADGNIIENGEAQPRGKKGLWRLTTTVRNANAPGTVFTVLARDFAGNLTTKKATIPIAGGKRISSEESPITANDKKQLINEATGIKITTRVVGSVVKTAFTRKPSTTSGELSTASSGIEGTLDKPGEMTVSQSPGPDNESPQTTGDADLQITASNDIQALTVNTNENYTQPFSASDAGASVSDINHHVPKPVAPGQMKFRKATRQDVPSIVGLLANDILGKQREKFQDPLPEEYYNAFERISADVNQELIVIEDEQSEVVGTLQLSFIPYLTYQGGIRAQIEAVRVREDQRGGGLGQKMFEWAIERAKERNAHLLQLTTDKQRPDAIRFYERLGFKASHEGMKMAL